MLDFDTELELEKRKIRLFPTTGIRTDREAELRATAALLAMIRAVAEFGRALTKKAGAPRGHIECYTEVPFPTLGQSKRAAPRPDGIIRVKRGKTLWVALVEVKVDDNPLDQRQFDTYLSLAGEHGFDALITISNQPADSKGLPPLDIDGRRLRKVAVSHWSWHSILGEAQMLASSDGIEDTDQQWMLAEWLRYIDAPDSRIIRKPNLGAGWTDIVKAAADPRAMAAFPALDDLIEHWFGFMRISSMRLRAQLGVEVKESMSRKERSNPVARLKRVRSEVTTSSCLEGSLKIPDAAGKLRLRLDLRARKIEYSTAVDAPDKPRAMTRINWLLRELKSEPVPEDLVVFVDWSRRTAWSEHPYGKAREQPEILCLDREGKKIEDATPVRFKLVWTLVLPKSRGKSTEPILRYIFDNMLEFYRCVLSNISEPVKQPPKLPSKAPKSAAVQAQPDAELPAPGIAIADASEEAAAQNPGDAGHVPTADGEGGEAGKSKAAP